MGAFCSENGMALPWFHGGQAYCTGPLQLGNRQAGKTIILQRYYFSDLQVAIIYAIGKRLC